MSVCGSHSDEELAYPLNTNFPSSPVSPLSPYSPLTGSPVSRLITSKDFLHLSNDVRIWKPHKYETSSSYPMELGIKTIQKLLENTSFMGEHISLRTLLLHPCWSYEASGTLTKIQRTVIIYGTQTNSKVKRSGWWRSSFVHCPYHYRKKKTSGNPSLPLRV